MISSILDHIRSAIPPEHARTGTIVLIWCAGLMLIAWNIFVVILYGDKAPTISEVTRDYSDAYPIWPTMLGVLIGHWLIPGVVAPSTTGRLILFAIMSFLFYKSYKKQLPNGAIWWFALGLPLGAGLWAMLPAWEHKTKN